MLDLYVTEAEVHLLAEVGKFEMGFAILTFLVVIV